MTRAAFLLAANETASMTTLGRELRARYDALQQSLLRCRP